MGYQFSRKHLLIAGGVAMALATTLWLLAGSQAEEPQAETARAEEHGQDDAIESPKPAVELAFEPSETIPTTDTEGQLPANWHQLTATEKTALNPLDCLSDENGVVHLRADNGECVEPEEANMENEDQPETAPRPAVKKAALGRSFAYSQDLDVIVNSWVCKPANEKLDDPISEGLWMDAIIDYEIYSNQDGLSQSKDATRDDTFGTDSERYLALSQKCRVILTGINTGSNRYLPDGCGLSFERSVTLIGQQKEYEALPIERLCTKNIIDFPHGARNQDTLFFDVDGGDEITEIIVRNPFGDEKYSIAVIWLGAIDLGL